MLIKTKLQAPSLRSRMLFRKQLVERLSEAGGYPLVMLSGPAGSGKTSLACQWIKQEKFQVAWYSLDEEDNEPDLFFRYLLTALAQADEQLKDIFNPLLVNQQRLGEENVIPHLIESMFGMDREIHLVLDDFHYIQNCEIHLALARMIQYLPACLHLIILSRYCLPAAVDAVAFKKERLEISGSNLRFTEQETAELFKRVIPLSFSLDQIHELHRHIEGWAAGLQLVGLTIQSQEHAPDVSFILNQTHEQVAGYLIHDILHMQSEMIRDFVFATALPDRFNPELCAEITGIEDADKMLSRLERMNLFLVPLDPDQKWYRYHQMFSEVVRRLVAVENPDLIPATLRKAALWFAANNYLEDAMRCAFRSEDFEFAADLMEDYIKKFSEQLDHTSGLRWILRLPLDILNQRTLLRLHQCHFLFILMEISDLKEILMTIESLGDRALERYSGSKRTLCEDYIIYLKCILQILQAKQSTDAVQLQALSKNISSQNPSFSRAIEMLVVSTLISKGDLSLAKALLAKVCRLTASIEVVAKTIYFSKAKVLMAKHQGRLHQAESIIRKVSRNLDQLGLGNTSIAFLLHRHLGHIYYLQNKLDEAWECASKAVRYCENSGLIDEVMAGNELRLLLHLAVEEKEKATQCIQRIRAYSVRLGMPQIAASADACAARIAVKEGNLAVAVLWSHRRNLQTDESFSLLFAMECLTQAHLFYAREKYTDAVDLLETLRKRCVKRNLLELVLQIDILRSAVLHAMNQHEKAVTLLRKALIFSETEDYVRPFVDNSELIAPILRHIKDELSGNSLNFHFEKVITACDISLSKSTISSGCENTGDEGLTQREIEIMEWMAKGSKNKEIAQKAFISLNTVKTHIRRIMAKLGVNTRIQAILKAKELGIISLD